MPGAMDDVTAALVAKHPLQRLNSPSRSVSALLHGTGLANCAYGFYFLAYSDLPDQMSKAYGSHYQFLTVIGLTLAAATFLLGLLADLALSRTLFFGKNALSVMSAPLEVLISTLYWSIVSIDRSLLGPQSMQLAPFIDCVFHLFPAVLLFLDLLFLSPPWTGSAFPALSVPPVLLAAGYWFWVARCKAINGFYPYPLMDVLADQNAYGLPLLFAGSAATMFVSSLCLRAVYTRFNGNLVGQSRPGDVKGKRA